MNKKRPRGLRFSELYLERGPPVEDSVKLRRRLAMRMHQDAWKFDLVQPLRAETGWTMQGYESLKFWSSLLEDLNVVEFLDFVTLFCQVLGDNSGGDGDLDFIRFAQRAFDEENVAFEVDDLGGVHHRVDAAYQQNRAAAMQALEGAENAAARASFEAAQEALRAPDDQALVAVRHAFDAVENIFKRLHSTSRLGASEVRKNLGAVGEASGSRAAASAQRINASFGEWVNACHQYRHADGEPDPTPPPRWLAITLVDSASVYIRYLTSA